MDKKANDLVIFEVAGLTTVADHFIICSADSQPQVRAIRDHIDRTLSQRGCNPFSTEGEEACRWVLMDYSDLVIHIFKEEIRRFYALERLWGDAPRLEVGAKGLIRPPAGRHGVPAEPKPAGGVRVSRRQGKSMGRSAS